MKILNDAKAIELMLRDTETHHSDEVEKLREDVDSLVAALSAAEARAAAAERLAEERAIALANAREEVREAHGKLLMERGARERLEGEITVERDGKVILRQDMAGLMERAAKLPEPVAPSVHVELPKTPPPSYELEVTAHDGNGRIRKMTIKPTGQ